jgi:hypothetical protein
MMSVKDAGWVCNEYGDIRTYSGGRCTCGDIVIPVEALGRAVLHGCYIAPVRSSLAEGLLVVARR